MKNKNFTHERLESTILNILNSTLKNEIYDEKIKMCSFTYVKLTNDNSILKVYIDSYDRTKIDLFVNKLNNAKGVFRTALSQNLKTYKVPIINFIKDESIDNVNNIEKLINEIKSKK